jgi:hypothetical protein
MNNFEDFYKGLNQSSNDEILQEPLTIKEISTDLAGNILQALSPVIGISFALTNTQKAEEFSKGVANYATSQEVISSLSEQIDKPKENETEQEFVERASNILRDILKKKFKV